MHKVSGLLLLAATSLTAFSQLKPDEDQIRHHRAESNQAIVKGDIDSFAASLTGDFVMVRGSGIFSNRETYIAAFAQDFKDPKAIRYQRIIDSVEVSKAAPLAAEHGHWIGHTPDGRPAYGGTYLAMWRKTNQDWKIRSELFVLLSCDDPALCAQYQNTHDPSKSTK